MKMMADLLRQGKEAADVMPVLETQRQEKAYRAAAAVGTLSEYRI
jgi:hypothetical protein